MKHLLEIKERHKRSAMATDVPFILKDLRADIAKLIQALECAVAIFDSGASSDYSRLTKGYCVDKLAEIESILAGDKGEL